MVAVKRNIAFFISAKIRTIVPHRRVAMRQLCSNVTRCFSFIINQNRLRFHGTCKKQNKTKHKKNSEIFFTQDQQYVYDIYQHTFCEDRLVHIPVWHKFFRRIQKVYTKSTAIFVHFQRTVSIYSCLFAVTRHNRRFVFLVNVNI